MASFIIIKFFICLFQIENCPIFKYLSSLQIFLRVANLFPESSRGVGARQQSPVPAKHHTGEAPSGRRDNSDQVRYRKYFISTLLEQSTPVSDVM